MHLTREPIHLERVRVWFDIKAPQKRNASGAELFLGPTHKSLASCEVPILNQTYIRFNDCGFVGKLTHHHHHHVVLLARISMILSRHFSLSIIASGRSSGLHPVSSQSCCMYVLVGRPGLPGHMWGSIEVHHL